MINSCSTQPKHHADHGGNAYWSLLMLLFASALIYVVIVLHFVVVCVISTNTLSVTPHHNTFERHLKAAMSTLSLKHLIQPSTSPETGNTPSITSWCIQQQTSNTNGTHPTYFSPKGCAKLSRNTARGRAAGALVIGTMRHATTLSRRGNARSVSQTKKSKHKAQASIVMTAKHWAGARRSTRS